MATTTTCCAAPRPTTTGWNSACTCWAVGQRPRIAWVTLGVLLLLTALAYLYVRRLLRRWTTSRGAQRFGAPACVRPAHPRAPCAQADELGQLAATINTMGEDIHQMLEAKRALLLALTRGCSPLTRAPQRRAAADAEARSAAPGAAARPGRDGASSPTCWRASAWPPPCRAAPRGRGPGGAGARGDRRAGRPPPWRRRHPRAGAVRTARVAAGPRACACCCATCSTTACATASPACRRPSCTCAGRTNGGDRGARPWPRRSARHLAQLSRLRPPRDASGARRRGPGPVTL